MVAQAGRNVLFNLSVAVAPDAESRFAAFEKRLSDVQAKADQQAVDSARNSLAQQENLHRQYLSSLSAMEQNHLDQVRRGREKDARDAENRLKQQAEKEKRERERSAREAESAAQKLYASNKQVTDSFTMATEGAIKLGQGIATLGIASEKDIEGLVRGLARVKGAADAIRGGIEIWRGITDGIRAYREAVAAAAVAEKALAAARAASAAAGGAQVAGVAGTAGLGGGGALMQGLAGVGAALTSLPGAIGLAIVGALAGGAMAFNVGGSRDWAAGKIQESGMVDPDRFLGWALASNASELWGGDSGTAIRENALAAAEKTSRMEQERAEGAVLAEAAGQRAADKARAESETREIERQASIREMEDRLRGRGLRGSDFDQARAAELAEMNKGVAEQARSRLAGLEGKQATDASGVAELDAQIAEARKEAAAASQAEIQSVKERLSVEERISKEKIAAADEAISKAEQEIKLREDAIQREQERLMSAQEKFALMSPEERQRTKELMQRAEAGEQLSAEEYDFLGKLGTGRLNDLRRQGLLDIAEREGFNEGGFGRDEQQRISEEEAAKKAAEITLKDQRELKVSIERDTDALVQTLSDEISRLMKERDEDLKASVIREVERKDRERVLETDRKMNALRSSQQPR